MADILIVDDEARHCQTLQEYLTHTGGHRVRVAGSAERAVDLAAGGPVDLVLLDVRLPGMDGLTAIARLRQLAPAAPVVVMTAFGTLDTAAAAIRQGVFEYLVKPFSLAELKAVLARALSPHAEEQGEGSPAAGPDEVVGRSPVMQRVFNRIALAAASDVPVLLTGETGTGKEVLARAVHRYSPRRAGPYVPVFLAALGPGVIESELFGHAKGAFTGADRDRAGLLEQAAGGTVLLDELGDVPPAVQVKLLRALEQREVTRVGEGTPRPVDVRVVGATHKSLPDLVTRGQFREDLYYRLSVFAVEVPPLRERREDIADLARHFLGRAAAATRCPGFSPAALAALESRPWHGNVRELRNVVEHAAVASRGAAIAPDHFPPPLARPAGDWSGAVGRWLDERLAGLDPLTAEARLLDVFRGEVEPVLVDLVLSRARRNQAAAARLLGLDPKTLRARLAQSGPVERAESPAERP